MNAPVGRHDDADDNQVADYAEVHPYVGPGHEIVADPPDPAAVNGVVDDGSVPVPIKAPGEPMRYRRDVRHDDLAAIVAEWEHIVAHLSSIAAEDDDPETNADDVRVTIGAHVDGDPEMVSILGTLDAEPNAPYLREDYNPAADDDGTPFPRYSERGRPGEPEATP